MPTYRNDTRSTVIVQNTDGAYVPVLPGDNVKTYEPVPGLAQTAATPANEITLNADPGADAFTDPIKPNPEGYLNISISGEGHAVVTLQRSFDQGITWKDMWDTSITGNDQEDSKIDHSKGVLYRIGVKNGQYSSGTVTFRLNW